MCVAFVSEAGVNLLRSELKRLHGHGRLLATTTFGTTTTTALQMAADCGTQVRVLNFGSSRTYHPKVYLGRGPGKARAVIGSSNMTRGLVTNVEAATRLVAPGNHAAVRDAWTWAHSLWVSDEATPWTGGVATDRKATPFDADLWDALQPHLRKGEVFETCTSRQQNTLNDFSESALYVATDRSRQRRSGPQEVPAWMFNIAWDYLRTHRKLSNTVLLNELRVHRSSAICAVLARLPQVELHSRRPLVLTWRG